MGLDSVELVIRFEDAFGIPISDEIAGQLTTPRKVTDYIMTQVAAGGQTACLSQEAFYFLRRGFSKRLQISRSVFHPDMSLEDIIPKRNRKIIWNDLKGEMGDAALPPLARPLWLFFLLATSTIVVGLYVFSATPRFPLQLNVWWALGIAIAFGFLSYFASQPLKTNFRRRFRTVRGLVEQLVVYSPQTFKRDGRTWTRTQVAETVRAIIIDETGVTNFSEDSRFIDDMNIG